MTRPHSDLRACDVIAIADSREQLPLTLHLPTERGTLLCGDYSVKNLEHLIAIERKGLEDCLSCVGRERERFERCIDRMRAYETRVIVIEATWGIIELGQWRSQLKPTQVKAALYSWMRNVTVILAGDRMTAANIVSGILFSAARNRYRELQAFRGGFKIAGQGESA